MELLINEYAETSFITDINFITLYAKILSNLSKMSKFYHKRKVLLSLMQTEHQRMRLFDKLSIFDNKCEKYEKRCIKLLTKLCKSKYIIDSLAIKLLDIGTDSFIDSIINYHKKNYYNNSKEDNLIHHLKNINKNINKEGSFLYDDIHMIFTISEIINRKLLKSNKQDIINILTSESFKKDMKFLNEFFKWIHINKYINESLKYKTDYNNKDSYIHDIEDLQTYFKYEIIEAYINDRDIKCNLPFGKLNKILNKIKPAYPINKLF